ncbi:hypothetical protein DERF_003498 [Dermatophagoides farinae]|uniref:Uncharacterized protein n=1 Tax=Dermatophagoides farinae TaxID=6954 RepID=A0A922IF49_DERFA|nr:hypothetical protein DERF_003498 [Dermatophagoides farinae]
MNASLDKLQLKTLVCLVVYIWCLLTSCLSDSIYIFNIATLLIIIICACKNRFLFERIFQLYMNCIRMEQGCVYFLIKYFVTLDVQKENKVEKNKTFDRLDLIIIDN